MADPQHLLDFRERLSQLTELEAVKEAYLAYIQEMFHGYRLCKTPPTFPHPGIGTTLDPQDLAHLEVELFFNDGCLYDELVCIVGHRKSLGWELTQWLKMPRALTLDRMHQLLLLSSSPSQDGQAEFFRRLRELSEQDTVVFSAAFLQVESARGLESALEVELPLGSRVLAFDDGILAALIPDIAEQKLRWPLSKGIQALQKLQVELGEPSLTNASIACWPADATTMPLFVYLLHQGLQKARRRASDLDERHPVVLFANQWYRASSLPEDDGGLGRLSPRNPIDPDLRGGNARRLDG